MQKIAFKTWLTRGTYPRLYLPILLIILVVSVVRYNYLIASEAEAACDRLNREVAMVGHFLLPTLAAASATESSQRLSDRLQTELRNNPNLEELRWQTQDMELKAQNTQRTEAPAPGWFAALVRLAPMENQFRHTLSNGTEGRLTVVARADAAMAQIWNTTGVQFKISALNIFTILFLLTILLRANARMLRRLSQATSRLEGGHLDTRMVVSGTLEARATAHTFNAMASRIQSLVLSLRQAQAQQAEQLNFTRQLVDALPLPVFVRSMEGTCLTVNQSWEQFFGVRVGDVVGAPMSSNFASLEAPASQAVMLPEQRCKSMQESEVSVSVMPGKDRQMAYFKAAFTNTDGATIGTVGTLVDITERKLAQDALKAEKERAEVTLASIGDGVITTDSNGCIDSINEAAQLLTGYSLAQALGRKLAEVFQFLEESAQSGNQILVHRSGERYRIQCSSAPIRNRNGTTGGTVLVFRDVTEAHHLRQKISWQARHNDLTGLNNRIALAEHMTHAVFRARQENTMLGVCIIDLDHFQHINDLHGSWTGDRVLKEVASRLRHFAGDDLVAHLSGDEFALLLCGQKNLRSLQNAARSLLHQLSLPYAIDALTLELSLSVGITVFPHDDVSPETLLRHADQAMCQAKVNGRSRIHFFDIELDQEIQTNHARYVRFAQALENNELRLYYQPKVNMRTRQIVGMEALLRWQHPTEGILSPGQFLSYIENTELIEHVGEWVLVQAIEQMKTWMENGFDWVVSVNIACRHFHRPDFVGRLRDIFEPYPQVPPDRLELEILESAALKDEQHMLKVMCQCQALGIRFALDDFGTGFSSLSYLKRLPAETIKIDQSFVRGLLDNQEDSTLIHAIVSLAKAFHRGVIAEGVENEAQSQRLLELGCELGQGYGIGRPMPADKVELWALRYNSNPVGAAVSGAF